MGLKLTESGDVASQMQYYHPTFLYESLWNIAGFVILHFLSKKRQYDGQIALGYAAWYGLGRTFIEGLRTDSLYIGAFRVSQLLAAVSCFAAATALVVLTFRKHPAEKLYVNIVAAQEALAAEEAPAEEQTEEELTEEQ
jgi:phosphatidylglycerol:prolipoprotein diacylglycerol transferase